MVTPRRTASPPSIRREPPSPSARPLMRVMSPSSVRRQPPETRKWRDTPSAFMMAVEPGLLRIETSIGVVHDSSLPPRRKSASRCSCSDALPLGARSSPPPHAQQWSLALPSPLKSVLPCSSHQLLDEYSSQPSPSPSNQAPSDNAPGRSVQRPSASLSRSRSWSTVSTSWVAGVSGGSGGGDGGEGGDGGSEGGEGDDGGEGGGGGDGGGQHTFQGGFGSSGKENHLMVAPATTIPVREVPSRAMIPERSGWFEQYILPFTLK
mmetsp:Transcript_22522/g.74286  ORF Transcript_22522/g.74286 Transcript_22522/m.74286 type:complete len:264 (+) Transcript_22522:1-792(+)